MSQAESKVEWCLRKAVKETSEGKVHKGLIRISPEIIESRKHILKGEHYIFASEHLLKGGFSDVAASTLFYAGYHALLAICNSFGYESRNQECTFSLIYWLIEERKIGLKKELVEKMAVLESAKGEETTSRQLREQYQYGTELSLPNDMYKDILQLARELLSEAREIVESEIK